MTLCAAQRMGWTCSGPGFATLVFVSTSRDHKVANMRVADAATGAVKDVMEEKVARSMNPVKAG